MTSGQRRAPVRPRGPRRGDAGGTLIGVFIGLVLGLATFGGVALALGDLRLAAAVAIALVVAGGLASAIGLALPWLLHRLGRDPAYGSGPLATIIQDVLSLAVYFASVTLVVRS